MPATSTALDTKTVRLIHLSRILGVLLFLAAALFVRSGPPAVMHPQLPVEGASLLGIVGFWLTGGRLALALTAAGIVLIVLAPPGHLAAE